jgi:hypothetical protein
MNNAKIKITVNILSSKSHVNNMNNVHNMPSSSLQKSLPIIRTISINNNNRNHNSKSIPKDIYHKNKVLKLSSDETPTFDMESSRNSSFITKHQPQTVQITKPRILSVIWAKSNNNNSNNNNICSNPLVNYTSPVKQQQSEVNDDDDASNFLNYNLGDLNNTILDTMIISQIINKDLKRHSLSALTKFYKIEMDEEDDEDEEEKETVVEEENTFTNNYDGIKKILVSGQVAYDKEEGKAHQVEFEEETEVDIEV